MPELSRWEPPADLRLLYEKDPAGDNPVKVVCRFHQDDSPSGAVYRDHFYCYGCRKNLGWHAFVKAIEWDPRDLDPEAEPPLAAEVGVSSSSGGRADLKPMPEEELRGLAAYYHPKLVLSGKIDYFLERGLTEETIGRAQLGHTGRAYVIPVWDRSEGGGVLRTLRFRRDDEITPPSVTKSKYWGLPGQNEVYLFCPRPLAGPYPTSGLKVIWCEGELDTLVAVQCGYTAVTLTNGIGRDVEPFLPRLAMAGVEELVLAVDQDGPGFTRALDLIPVFRQVIPRVRVARFFAKDISDLHLAKGPEGVRAALGEPSAAARSPIPNH